MNGKKLSMIFTNTKESQSSKFQKSARKQRNDPNHFIENKVKKIEIFSCFFFPLNHDILLIDLRHYQEFKTNYICASYLSFQQQKLRKSQSIKVKLDDINITLKDTKLIKFLHLLIHVKFIRRFIKINSFPDSQKTWIFHYRQIL